MKTIHIPQLARDVSRLGIGSMVFSAERKDMTFGLLDTFFSLGGNLIDTAEVYGTEGAVKLWLEARGNRESAIILAKGCHYPQYELNEKAIRESISGSLERLGTDYIDIWAFHRDNPEIPVQAIVETLNDEVAKGRIRAFGASNWSTARVAEANAYAQTHGLMEMAIASPHVCLAVAKEPFWAGCAQATDEDLAWHAKTGVPLVAWSSQGRGFFLDSSGPDATNADLIRVYHNAGNFERLARVRGLAKARSVAPVQIALAYVLNLPAAIIALVGPATPAEVESCVAAEKLSLTQTELDWLNLRRQTL